MKLNITKALDGVTVSIEQGEFVAVVGTSGSVKVKGTIEKFLDSYIDSIEPSMDFESKSTYITVCPREIEKQSICIDSDTGESIKKLFTGTGV